MTERRGTQPLAAMSVMRLQRWELVIEAGPDKDSRVRLDDGALVIGSGPECDWVLRDDTVSSRHCEVMARGEKLLVRDLGSRNGVVVAGVQVLEALVEPKVILKLGNTRVKVTASAEDQLVSQAVAFGPLYGKSAAMRALFAQLPAVAASEAPLLIEGETGTGKDVTAQAIHDVSPRAGGPCVVFDCGAVAASLVEAELFGYEKNAFTGATAAKAGLVEAADGGTLIIDEVGELPLELQPKLLRLVERREIRRVGSTASSQIDVRIIACTHRSLRAEVKAGRFREDLFFRLSALRLRLPALRERADDLPGLVDAMFSERGSAQRFDQLAESDRGLLLSHRWPGNVRELRNVTERLLTFPSARGSALLDVEGSAAHSAPSGPLPALTLARQRAQDAFEQSYVREALLRSGGSITEAAKLAGVSRQFLQRLVKKHALR